jgi:hypothetical protein
LFWHLSFLLWSSKWVAFCLQRWGWLRFRRPSPSFPSWPSSQALYLQTLRRLP